MKHFLFALLLTTFSAFGQTNPPPEDLKPVALNFTRIHFKDAMHIEDSVGGKVRFSRNKYYIGEDAYPNKNNYPLSNARLFDRDENSYLLNEVEYFVNTQNDSVKAIMYEWNTPIKDRMYVEQPVNTYNNKVEQLKQYISSQLGKPTSKKIESKKNPNLYIDSILWENINGVTVLIWRYGNAAGDGQIRVVVYWD